ncbi:MAG TPA: response regulator, partial [Phototrophicaceae bacterium]|nr:response regulator [Phototrophicaceae bacterium]
EFQTLFSGGKITGHHTKRQTKDGRLLDVQLSAAAYRDKDGQPVGSIVVLRDVTQQRRAEEALRHSEERYRTLLEQIKEGYYEINLDGQLTFCNNSLGEVLGYARSDLLTQRIDDLMDAYNAANLRQLAQQVFATGQPATAQDCEIITKTGERKSIEISALAMRNEQGQPIGYRGLARDITERKRIQAELQQAKDAAETANRAKSVFLANMSHELRTPLNAILGYSEMLQEDSLAQGYTAAAADLQKIQAAGRHLLDLINNILDLSKIEAGKMDLYLEKFNLPMMIEEVQTTIQPLAAKNKNTLVVTCPPDIGTMVADVTKLRQILFNLLSNACKFTSNGTVKLALSRQRSDNTDWVLFYVTDTGIGLNTDQMNDLFKEFTQADSSTTRKYGGTGLGLAISRHFCQMMSGDIQVESLPGQGTTFTVRLPADVAQRKIQAASLVGSPPPAAPAGTVLVIDDDATVRDLLAHALTKEGFRVETAADGEQGLQLAQQIRPDVITLDVLIPGKDGWAILAALKADPDLAAIPVIMLSITDDKQMGFSLGAADYLTKPIDRNQLVAALNRYTRGKTGKNHVLVVEDDPATRAVISQTLQKEGWLITSVENGVAALATLNVKLPDLILLDLMMPEMDGFQLVAELRKNATWSRIPVIVMTALTLTEAEIKQLNGQVERILQKSVSGHAQLLREVRDLVTIYTQTPPPPKP